MQTSPPERYESSRSLHASDTQKTPKIGYHFLTYFPKRRARPVQIVLLVFPKTGDIDKPGELALSILRDFGLPNLVPVVIPPADAPLKVRSASKKLATEAFRLQVDSATRAVAGTSACKAESIEQFVGLWRVQASMTSIL